MKGLLFAAMVLCLRAAGQAEVVRPAPNFGLEGTPHVTSLRSLRGQPVVLVIAQDARNKYFRRQVYRLRSMYQQFATEKVIFVVAVENGPVDVRSDIPFVAAANPAEVAAEYGVTGRFAIAVIGIDGNLDMITSKVINAERVLDMVFNNDEVQAGARKQPEQ